jgi:hypothetical protein
VGAVAPQMSLATKAEDGRMSTFKVNPGEPLEFQEGQSDSRICFICGGKFSRTEGSIKWCGDIAKYYFAEDKGNDVIIDLHVDCAHFMAAGMMRDILDARLGKEVTKAWYAKYRQPEPPYKGGGL